MGNSLLLLSFFIFSLLSTSVNAETTKIKEEQISVADKNNEPAITLTAGQQKQCAQFCSAITANETYKQQVKQRQNPKSNIAYESVDPKPLPAKKRWTDFLPILGEKSREAGYVLPLPMGISVIGLTQKQPFTVNNIALEIDGKPNERINDLIDESIEAKNLIVTNTAYNLRLDAWILPFWNVYGVLGKVQGEANLELEVDLEIPTLILTAANIGNGAAEKRCNSIDLPYSGPAPGNCLVTNSGYPTRLNYHGTVTGYGTTIAGGYGDFFGMFDVNFTQADINIAVKNTKQTVYSARIGWNGKINSYHGQFWVGAMKQDIKQQLEISSPEAPKVIILIDQEVSSPLNYLIGGQWNISEEWALIAETSFAFSDRQQFMMQLGYRF
ncbi:hypothetical protein [Colwellia echini]|uniref:Uncharacterized protein n=1 Tax=Colwellia echini TaxID=1982103 RepID=A0ABY3MUX8_9GAMM|nr:hypothetical protein [Colwellia echini]TYK64994.1 hypothetical protein CWS31_012780 [Colwellia echini]